ncbi:MAG: 6-carboxytetrahydropterin synthase QueD [Deltaproteobacteria bacterium]|nr:6-carboxytetrahydropterin synthase QueD [Deltaproteobacteria bacterium]
MYELTVEADFSSAHNLRGYEGACERLHGHNWKVEVRVEARRLDKIDMAVDFKVLRAEINSVVEKLDHRYLNEAPPFDRLNPTAENIARHIYKELSSAINDGNVRVREVKVWESEKAAAAYHE